jgi:predicted transcriptional regulator
VVATTLNLGALDDSPLSRQLDLVSEVFHRINRVLPVNQTLFHVPPNWTARQAIAEMEKQGYSQAPVMHDGGVVGVFSYRSFAREAAKPQLDELKNERYAPGDLRVDECLEAFEFSRVTDEMVVGIEKIRRNGCLVVGTSQNKVLGVISPADFLAYLYQVAMPFVTLSEIELSVRKLIELAMDEQQLQLAATRTLLDKYGKVEKIPVSLSQMSFEDYKNLVQHNDNWPAFEPLFGGNRQRVTSKLKDIASIRNYVFHFKGEIHEYQRDRLQEVRDWLLAKVKFAPARLSAGTTNE